jgi:hypothetical protein
MPVTVATDTVTGCSCGEAGGVLDVSGRLEQEVLTPLPQHQKVVTNHS